MTAHPNQISYFLERANQHHSHDKEFMELVEKTDFEKLSTSTMQSLNKLISLAFMDSSHRLTIKKRLSTFIEKGGEQNAI